MEVTLKSIAQLLFDRISIETDKESLIDLGEVGRVLEPSFDKAGHRGLGRELFIWAGLKVDQPTMGDSYGSGINDAYPEIFGS